MTGVDNVVRCIACLGDLRDTVRSLCPYCLHTVHHNCMTSPQVSLIPPHLVMMFDGSPSAPIYGCRFCSWD